MKTSRITAFVGIATIVLAAAAPGFAQQSGASCSQDIAQARAQIWRGQAALDISKHMAPVAGRSKSLASSEISPPQGSVAVGRSTIAPSQGEVAVGRSTALPQPEASGTGRSKSLASSEISPPQGQVAVGRSTIAPSQGEVAVGRSKSLASSEISPPQGQVAVGRSTIAPSQGEVAVGRSTIAPSQGEVAVGRSKSLASSEISPPQGQVAVGRSTIAPSQGEVAVGRSTIAPSQGEVSGTGRALAAAPGFTPVSSAGRVSSTANAQFRVLASNQDRKAFVETLNVQERSILYSSLSPREKKMFTSAVGAKDVSAASDQETKAWAEKIASDRGALSQKIQKARVLARAAQDLCKKGDSAGATAKAKEAMDVLK